MTDDRLKTPMGNPFKSHKFPLKVRIFFVLTRLLFRSMGRVTPKLAAKLALQLFMTPPKFPSPQRELRVREKSNHSFQMINGERIAVYEWGKGPVILLSHGWGGRGTHFYALIELLVSSGYRVIAFDAPAHGRSSGKRTNALEVTKTLVAIATSLGPIKALIGHSFGCGTALLAMERFEVKAEKLILFSCYDDIYWITEQFGEAFAMSKKVIAAMRDEAHRKYHNVFVTPWQWHQLSPVNTIKGIRTDILLLHDQQDQEVPYQHAKNLVAVAPHARLITTTGLGHKKILRNRACLDNCLEFIHQKRSQSSVSASE